MSDPKNTKTTKIMKWIVLGIFAAAMTLGVAASTIQKEEPAQAPTYAPANSW